MKPQLVITYKENMINKDHNSKEGELLNHLKINSAITPSLPILAFQKYCYHYLNQKMKLRINSISHKLIYNLYVSQPPTNMVRVCTITRETTPIKPQRSSPKYLFVKVHYVINYYDNSFLVYIMEARNTNKNQWSKKSTILTMEKF